MDAPAPARRLSPLARWVWALQQLAFWGVVTFVGAGVSAGVEFGGALLWALPLLVLVVAVVGVPALRWRRWRWDIRDEGIDIQHGTFAITRTLVPWVRVQHVDTRRGVFEQLFGLSTVVVHTAAGGHTIPLLPAGDAEQLRERIAGLARTDEDELAAGAEHPSAELPATAGPAEAPPSASPPGVERPGPDGPGAAPPSASPPGVEHPGPDGPGAAPPSAARPGAAPPAAAPPSTSPPSADRPGAAPPAAAPPSTSPPSADRPGAAPRSAAPPGAAPEGPGDG